MIELSEELFCILQPILGGKVQDEKEKKVQPEIQGPGDPTSF